MINRNPDEVMAKIGLRSRSLHVAVFFVFLYGAIIAKLVYLGIQSEQYSTKRVTRPTRQQLSWNRPDILDRNGELLATDVKTFSLYAEPRLIPEDNVNEVMNKLSKVIPGIKNSQTIRKRLSSRAGFAWIKRKLAGNKRQKIFNLGIPGTGFIKENGRFYPGGGLASHVVGYVNVDNRGLAGIEKHIDSRIRIADIQRKKTGASAQTKMKEQQLALDTRVQHVVRNELSNAIKLHRAKAGVGIVLNVHTGEVLAMVSLPDFNLNNPGRFFANEKHMNRATAGIYEMGSIFKIFNTALALDRETAELDKIYPISKYIQIGRHKIKEFHYKKRPLNVAEIFIYSSNVGSVHMALEVGPVEQREFFDKLGLLQRLKTELPELRDTQYSSKLSDINTATMSFGHGIAVSPLHVVASAAAMINGGLYIPPTFFPRSSAEASKIAKRVIKKTTSDEMIVLLRLCVEEGSCKNAEVPGYQVGGKTGTAEKITEGKYAKDRHFNSFLAAFPSAFPLRKPEYVLLVVLDEPMALDDDTADLSGNTCAKTASKIISRIAGMLDVKPAFGLPSLKQAYSVRDMNTEH